MPSCVSVGTVRVKLAPVKALLADALEDGVIRSNPAAGVTIKGAPATGDVDDEDEAEHVKALTGVELESLLAALPDEWRLLFRFLGDSGLRIGEAVALKWGDVDTGAALVQVRRRRYRGRNDRPKSNYGRRKARISAEVAAELRTLRAGRADDELVFPNNAGTYLDPGNVMSRVLKPATVKAGLGQWVVANGRRHAEWWVGFHTFRHTCATVLFEAGWNAKQVQLQLGHHKPSFTLDTYIHLMPGDLPAHPGATRR